MSQCVKKCVSLPIEKWNEMKKTYKIKNTDTPEVNEPASVYHAVQQMHLSEEAPIPVGCVTLDQFGEIFHQKLDECYEKLSGSRQ